MGGLLCNVKMNLCDAPLLAIIVCLTMSATTTFAYQNEQTGFSNRSFTPQTGTTVLSSTRDQTNASPSNPMSSGRLATSPVESSEIKLRKASWHSSEGQTSEKKIAEKRTIPGSSASLWTTFGTLAAMIVGILIIARLAKRKTGLRSQTIPTEAMEILGRKTVDPQNGIYLVRCGSRILMLGASDNGLRTLCEINDPLEIDYLSGMCRTEENETGSVMSFQSLFRRQTGSNPEPKQSSGKDVSTKDEDLKNRLMQMLSKRGGPS